MEAVQKLKKLRMVNAGLAAANGVPVAAAVQ
jgi:hypothetical protein